MPNFSFDVQDAPEIQGKSFEPLPKGQYDVMIIKSDVKPTKAGTGHYIELEMQVIEGEYSGRRHWERLNVSNPNKQAEDIAKANLAAICEALGIEKINETEELHDQPFVALIDIDRKDATRNRIVGYASAQDAPHPAPASKPAAKPAASNRAKPWA